MIIEDWRCLTCGKNVKLGSFSRDAGLVMIKDRTVQIDLVHAQVLVYCPLCLTPHRIELREGIIYSMA